MIGLIQVRNGLSFAGVCGWLVGAGLHTLSKTGNIYRVVYWTICILRYFLTLERMFVCPGERRPPMKEVKDLLHELVETLSEEQAAYAHRLLATLFVNDQPSVPKL